MQLMCDVVCVLGSRHGVLLDPIRRKCGIIRFDRFDCLPELRIRAGVVVDGREIVLPLTPQGPVFRFHDQRMTPCTSVLMGIDPASGIKLRLEIVTPFRPRDGAFSTTPVLGLRLEASKIAGSFRWEGRDCNPDEVEVFLEMGGPAVTREPVGDDAIDMCFQSVRSSTAREGTTRANADTEAVEQRDRLVVVDGSRTETGFRKRITFGERPSTGLTVAWCTYSPSTLSVRGELCPFKYNERLGTLDDVANWARANVDQLFVNARVVDGVIAAGECSKSTQNLLAYTLHSWLIDTWWVNRKGRDWFSVWEGSCYFHSTVDVEYTQSPFYLAVWPELLGIELDFWPEFSKDGRFTVGDRGAGTLFLSHDTGSHSTACGQDYHHEMEVEETANYVILSYAYWKRTGDDSLLRKHVATIEAYLRFLLACDTTGNGVPDQGVANTIDDASPAVQYGSCQIYLAVKCLGSFKAGAEILEMLGHHELVDTCRETAGKIRALIAERGWQGEHFATLLGKEGKGIVDPWSGEKIDLPEIPGWDAPHIYTVNGLVPFDMVGVDLGLDEEKVATDLRVATKRCLREYGCVHTDFSFERASIPETMKGLAGVSRNPGWISMNMLRDIAAFYRGVDLRHLADRYWEWQVVTNTQEPKVFFETFSGNNLCFYPRGIVIWGYFDGLAGIRENAVDGDRSTGPKVGAVCVPRLLDVDWRTGQCEMVEG
ncbi:MAG: DUF4965 domain-containing protein [Lentisphaerae bacterium]|jgi:xylan 1,4-beta-xylosidase|nr:DUF4965 domain-containing protein [Lentisphaerota bacterium]MBT5604681.1 DUF4965 domain-containing protein [Lentisphaerota bacterium]MBT7053819.1 DUF4965 domain-containing protein [Lentisphaerota bacterium]MBT7847198.1 DUF4965 domain-containing protein [Lentisphaerota bacterium]